MQREEILETTSRNKRASISSSHLGTKEPYIASDEYADILAALWFTPTTNMVSSL